MNDRNTKAASRARIDAAAKATDAVLDGFHEARGELQNCDTNGAGVLYDPSLVGGSLRRARAAIDKAIAAMDGCTWPSNDDYDRC